MPVMWEILTVNCFRDEERELLSLAGLLFFSFTLPGETVHSPDHQTTTLATMKSNLIWRHQADISFKSPHSTLIKPADHKYIEKVRRWRRISGRVKEEGLHPLKVVEELWLFPIKDNMCVGQHQLSYKSANTMGCFRGSIPATKNRCIQCHVLKWKENLSSFCARLRTTELRTTCPPGHHLHNPSLFVTIWR